MAPAWAHTRPVQGHQRGWAQPLMGGREEKQRGGHWAVRTDMAHVREGVAERAPDAASQPNLGVVLRVQLALLWVACLAEKTVQAEACRVSQLLDEAHCGVRGCREKP